MPTSRGKAKHLSRIAVDSGGGKMDQGSCNTLLLIKS